MSYYCRVCLREVVSNNHICYQADPSPQAQAKRELEARLARAEQEREGAIRDRDGAHKISRDLLRAVAAERDAALAQVAAFDKAFNDAMLQVAALRERLADLADRLCDGECELGDTWKEPIRLAQTTLSDTAAAAQEHEKRIQREAREDERERCAKVAEHESMELAYAGSKADEMARVIAAAVRALEVE